jgi:hypothetical protein
MSQKVLAWINQHFSINQIKVEDFPVFPGGKRIIDHTGVHMVVYWDILHERVDYYIPEQ